MPKYSKKDLNIAEAVLEAAPGLIDVSPGAYLECIWGIAQAIAAEREACAKVAELPSVLNNTKEANDRAASIAAAIRNLVP